VPAGSRLHTDRAVDRHTAVLGEMVQELLA